MITDNSSEYYRIREARELKLAAQATNPKIRDLHMVLAKRYAEQAAEAIKREEASRLP